MRSGSLSLRLGLGPQRTGTSTPQLLSGITHRINPAIAATFGGSLPSNGASITGSIYGTDSSGTAISTWARTSSASATYTTNAVDGLPGITSTNASNIAYTCASAGAPSNFYQTGSLTFTHYIKVYNATNGFIYFAYKSTGQIAINNQTTDANNGTGLVNGANKCYTLPIDAGVNVIAIVCSNSVIGTQAGSGSTDIYVNGVVRGHMNVQLSGRGASDDLIFLNFRSDGQFGAGFKGTVMDDIYYHNVAHTSVQVRYNTRVLFQGHTRTVADRMIIFGGNSIWCGVNAITAGYNFAALVESQNGVNPLKVTNYARGGFNWSSMETNAQNEVDPLMLELGGANTYHVFGEGTNDLGSSGFTAAQAEAHAVAYCRARIAAGHIDSHLYLANLFGVTTTVPGFAKYRDYADRIKLIPANYADLANVNIIDVAANANMGVASDAATNAGFYGTTAAGSNGAGANSDGTNGLLGSGTAGVMGDTVHWHGKNGYNNGNTATWYGYNHATYLYFRALYALL